MSNELAALHEESEKSPSPQEPNPEDDEEDWAVSLAFSSERHVENIEGLEEMAQNWRLKDKVSHLALIVF